VVDFTYPILGSREWCCRYWRGQFNLHIAEPVISREREREWERESARERARERERETIRRY
jgi:hypothetical protein